jgi:FkbH-like protein
MYGVLLSDFNIANLAGYLQNDTDQPAVTAVIRNEPLGGILGNPDHPCWQPQPEFVVVWTLPETSIAAFSEVRRFRGVGQDDIQNEVDRYTSLLLQLAQRVPVVLACSWVASPADRGLGMLDMHPEIGVSSTLMRMNLRVADGLTGTPNVYLLDSARWMVGEGLRTWNDKGWYLAKIPFGNAVFKSAASDIKAALRGIRGQARKLVIVDADDTLWGGSVGELGWQRLQIGGHDPYGEAFAAFQRRLQALTNRGVLLGIVSRNDESLVLEALEAHPEMVLRPRDFAGWRINWADKAENVADLVSELNLGLDSAVFLDDHPAERARIRETMPDVLVPELPEDKLLLPQFLARLPCFDTPGLTLEDVSRHDSYAASRRREAARASIGNLERWLETLDTKITVDDLCEGNLDRAAQLFNKTNQMNLATRRLSASELRRWVRSGDRRLWTFRAADRFGEYGLVGLLSVEVWDGVGRVVDFVLSCRIMGRQLEQVMLQQLEQFAAIRGLERVEARLIPTARNTPCLRFWQQSGWQELTDLLFVWTVDSERQMTPTGIEVTTRSVFETAR